MRPIRALAVLALTSAVLTACASGPSVADLPDSLAAEPAESAPVEYTDQLFAGGSAVRIGDGWTSGGTDVVPPAVPRNPVEAFRAFETVCGQYAALAGRNDESYPRVEPDRFAGATLLREIDDDTALVADGRGTVLLVESWTSTPTLLPVGFETMPDPYREGCPPEPVLSLQPPVATLPDR